MSRYGKSAKSISEYRSRQKPRRSRSGPGYDTSRTGSNYDFEIRIEHGKLDKSIAAAKRSIASDLKAVEKIFSGTLGSGSGNSISVSVPRKNSDLTKLITKIQSRLDSSKFIDSLYTDYASQVGKLGVNNMRHGIKNPENSPVKFRYETGLMYNSVRYKKVKLANAIVIKIGWLDRFYKYFDFQERGTRQVGAMNAITHSYRTTSPQAYKLMSKFLNNYTNKGGSSGRYTR